MEAKNPQESSAIPIQPSDIPGGSKSQGRKPYRMGSIVIVLVLCVVSFVGGVFVPRAGYSTNNNQAVCGSADIQIYNKFVTQQTSTDAQRKDKGTQMQAQVNQLKKKGNFADDPNCLFIEYSAAITSANLQTAQTAYDALKKLSDNGVYPSNEILDITSISSMHDRIEALRNVGKGNTDPKGSG